MRLFDIRSAGNDWRLFTNKCNVPGLSLEDGLKLVIPASYSPENAAWKGLFLFAAYLFRDCLRVGVRLGRKCGVQCNVE